MFLPSVERCRAQCGASVRDEVNSWWRRGSTISHIGIVPVVHEPSRLARRLGVGDAVVIGLGSMIGAGVFAAFGPAARRGRCRSADRARRRRRRRVLQRDVASAQLAAQYPESGGTYVYGRERLGPWWGFLAGWGFVIGKTASCAAMALTFAAYAVPPAWQRPVAVAAVLALTAVNYRGVHPDGRLTRVIVAGRPRTRWPSSWPVGLAGGSAGPPVGSTAGPARSAGTGCSSPPACCSSPSPGTPASRRWARRCATRRRPSRVPSRWPWASAGRLQRRRRRPLLAAGPDRARRVRGAPGRRRRAAGSWLGRRRGRCGGRRLAGRAALAARRHRPHHPRDGPPSGTCPAGWAPSTRGTGCRTGPNSSWRPWCRGAAVADLRGAIGFSSVRRADLLRDRQRIGVDAAARRTAVAAAARRARPRRLRRAGADAARPA